MTCLTHDDDDDDLQQRDVNENIMRNGGASLPGSLTTLHCWQCTFHPKEILVANGHRLILLQGFA